ncbi:MAG: hypothetical protein CMK23_08370 [Porticoccaceae bacterium]|nr:hypothetical protein [Porticoccaceae bacterium]MAK89544.1 hypothetical protein [Euryarchaeota archaeon]|tara:strand:- start:8312 stop:8746 length:435 start_codon:yes stop_codon:yes gene_type:complete
MANEAEKNVRPEVAAFVNKVQDDLHKKLDIFMASLDEVKQDCEKLRNEVSTLKMDVSAASNSIETIAIRTKDLIDKRLSGNDDINKDFKKEVSEMIDGYSEQVANFQLSVDEMMSKVERYFRKEKYAITKGMITEIINEEKLNG